MAGVIHYKKKILSDADIATFCQQVGMVVKAGLPIHYGISLLHEEAPTEHMQAIIDEIYIPMKQGGSLYSAIANVGIFPEYMVEMIHLGEETGRLEEVLDSLSSYYEREAEIRSSIRHSLLYPIIMTFLMILVLSIILTQVVPVFSQIYEELIGELSGAALLLMNISKTLDKHALLFSVLLISATIFTAFFYHSSIGKSLFHGKGLSMSLARSRFANCMHLALASGLEAERGLDLAERLVDNPYMLEKINRCKLHIHHGENFISAVIHAGIFSKVYSGLLIIGSKTGSMVEVMARIGNSYEEETDRKIHRLLTILEPTLIIILTIFIGLILFAFIFPILNIIL